MKTVNWFYISMVLIALGLVWLFLPKEENELAFFGFAENLETEINYNYPVMVEKILVSPGESIEKGAALISLKRQKAKEELEKENFRIATTYNEMEAWQSRQDAKRTELILDYEEDLADLLDEISKTEMAIEKEKKLKQQFYENELQPSLELSQKMDQLKAEEASLITAHQARLKALELETKTGLKPYYSEIDELEAEKDFAESQKSIPISVEAPQTGLVGNINCREGEHIPAFKTLMTFYEPHSSIVKGYIHEESILEVHKDVVFEVSSLLKPEVKYQGVLIGMGSRIVEIPTRLRKFPQIKSYGREITIQIPAENIFLQKEKVSVKLINGVRK